MAKRICSRRRFLQISGLGLAVTLLTAVPAAARPRPARLFSLKMYRLSVRGRKASLASKKNCANKRFATRSAALRRFAHPGDNPRVVALDVSFREFYRLFIKRRRLVVDLRHV